MVCEKLCLKYFNRNIDTSKKTDLNKIYYSCQQNKFQIKKNKATNKCVILYNYKI